MQFLLALASALSLLISPRVTFPEHGLATIHFKVTVNPDVVNEELTVGYIRCADAYDEFGTPVEPDDSDCIEDNPFTNSQSSSIQLFADSPRNFYRDFRLPPGYYRAFANLRRLPDHKLASLTQSSFRVLESVP